MDDLKECPFCGAAPIMQVIEAHTHSDTMKFFMPGIPDHKGSATIECPTRGCCGMIASTAAEVIAAWNRRAVPQASAEQDALLERERRDAQSLASLLIKERRRFEFLHSTNCDAEGWEWGVARIRVNEYGECEYLWGVADHSDIDAAIAAAPQVSKGSGHD